MKKIICVIISLVITMSLAACGTDNATPKTNVSEKNKENNEVTLAPNELSFDFDETVDPTSSDTTQNVVSGNVTCEEAGDKNAAENTKPYTGNAGSANSDSGNKTENNPGTNPNAGNGNTSSNAGNGNSTNNTDSGNASNGNTSNASGGNANTGNGNSNNNANNGNAGNNTTTTPSKPVGTVDKPQGGSSTHDHTYTTNVVKPTCTTEGYTVHKCSCGSTYTDNVVPAEHQDLEFQQTRDAAYNFAGYDLYYCNACRSEVRLNETKALTLYEYQSAIESATAKYINQFRNRQGAGSATRLSGLNQVARYRASQLVYYFSHNDSSGKLALKAVLEKYQYGEYIDATQAGLDESYSYWEVGPEAIGKMTGVGYASPDEIGYELAEMFYSSSGHWDYVGSSMYPYFGIGVTFTEGASDGFTFKVCVIMTDTNYG